MLYFFVIDSKPKQITRWSTKVIFSVFMKVWSQNTTPLVSFAFSLSLLSFLYPYNGCRICDFAFSHFPLSRKGPVILFCSSFRPLLFCWRLVGVRAKRTVTKEQKRTTERIVTKVWEKKKSKERRSEREGERKKSEMRRVVGRRAVVVS